MFYATPWRLTMNRSLVTPGLPLLHQP
jgi:hypothetical protein